MYKVTQVALQDSSHKQKLRGLFCLRLGISIFLPSKMFVEQIFISTFNDEHSLMSRTTTDFFQYYSDS